MADEFAEISDDIEKLKSIVRKSFARIYASLKARELKTLRQLEAIYKHCQDNEDQKKNCVKSIEISYDNESELLNNIGKYGAVEFDNLNFDSSTFLLEDYVSPYDDHMYLYKSIEDMKELEIIEEAALKEITKNEDCVCNVTIRPEDVAKNFRNMEPDEATIECNSKEDLDTSINTVETSSQDDTSESSENDVKKIEPTEDWLNTIKNQTETEPLHTTDLMEHSTIVCT
ncbi:unnamed protein product [Pieris macdunnoughi]|uniref:Uncharacterized protein n=1 Tax=Pieris macdunnoughi TaxID=345717 RepID=A0A821V9G9_9NEOP|nr:unnamed protein product [Pieris macdunnoughi]